MDFVLIVLGIGLGVAVIDWRFGAAAALGLTLAGVAGILLVLHPRIGLALFVVVIAWASRDPGAGIADTSALYRSIAAIVTPVDLLLAGVAVAVLLFAMRHTASLRLPDPFTLPLALMAVAAILGTITGHYGGASLAGSVGPVVTLSPLLLLPVLIAIAGHMPGDGRRIARLGIVILAVATLLSLAGLLRSGNVDNTVESQATFAEPTSNWLVVVLILGLTGALLARSRVPARLLAFLPLAIAALVFSYKRSFWIATVVGLAVVLVIAPGRVGRRLLVPVIVVIGVSLYLALTAAGTTGLEGPVAERARSLSPAKVGASQQDRYRIGERRNVLAEIRDAPLTGVGTGVDWRGRYGVTLDFTGQRNYVHVGILWYWLKFGVLGAIAYLWILGTAVSCGLRVFRLHPDRTVGLAGLAVGVGTLALAVGELTASWIGPDPRLTIVFGAALGFLAVARRETMLQGEGEGEGEGERQPTAGSLEQDLAAPRNLAPGSSPARSPQLS